MSERFKTILLFGAPGAGKGTQGELIGNVPGFLHMSTGDMFRSLDRKSELGQTIESYSSKGELVPDELTIELWQRYMNELIEKGQFTPNNELLILDGIPRTCEQAKLMEPLIDVLAVVHLAASDSEAMIQRLRQRALQQKRNDDADEDVIRNRLEIYERDTRPVLNSYDTSLVHDIDALDTMAMVMMNVMRVVAPIHADHVQSAHH